MHASVLEQPAVHSRAQCSRIAVDQRSTLALHLREGGDKQREWGGGGGGGLGEIRKGGKRNGESTLHGKVGGKRGERVGGG